MRPALTLPFVVRPHKRKRPISLKMYALLTMAITCLCLCAFQYAILAGTHAAHIELPHHLDLALRIGEIAGKRRNGSEAWDVPQDISTRFGNISHTKLFSSSVHEGTSLEIPSLTAVLPVTSASLPNLERQLHTLINRSDYLAEVVLIPREGLHKECRRIILSVLASSNSTAHVELSLAPWLAGADKASATLHTSRQASTSFLLILDEDGLESIDERGRDALTLLSPFSSAVPIGPRGLTSTGDEIICLSASEIPQPADYLIPPFVIQAALLLLRPDSAAERSYAGDTWRILGKTISNVQNDSVGGFMVGSETVGLDRSLCKDLSMATDSVEGNQWTTAQSVSDAQVEGSGPSLSLNDVCSSGFGSFAALFASVEELESFSPAACLWQTSGHTLHIAIVVNSPVSDLLGQASSLRLEHCSLDYHILLVEDDVQSATTILGWLGKFPSPADAVITSLPKNSLPGTALSLYGEGVRKPIIIHIPGSDLPYCDWIGTLNLEELTNWHVPQVTVSIITNDRPQSLSRLLESLSRARYFGDELDLRINVEQTADFETQQIVSDYSWRHGRVFLHRRIIHGGLLPAVVESWYPQSNDSYGLILEDDVELSPLFYAWIKLTLLRYRYGLREDASSQLFGISLYQQKHLELRPEGRHPFNARNMFASVGLGESSTPYFSQIPCSWGALYFPEHWREFHAYLSFRLSEYAWDADQVVVPGVRSNKWTRSWKKYFIELAYLRGYVMLYPNYADYVSLSTNHLEVGSHVKDVPLETYLRKKRLFLLPLMQLPEPAQPSSTGLLDLPLGQLPAWTDLPTLDLLGLVASMETVQERGHVRRTELTGCEDRPNTQYDVWDLLCLHDPLLGLQ